MNLTTHQKPLKPLTSCPKIGVVVVMKDIYSMPVEELEQERERCKKLIMEINRLIRIRIKT